jgi:hypothetical protein
MALPDVLNQIAGGVLESSRFRHPAAMLTRSSLQPPINPKRTQAVAGALSIDVREHRRLAPVQLNPSRAIARAWRFRRILHPRNRPSDRPLHALAGWIAHAGSTTGWNAQAGNTRPRQFAEITPAQFACTAITVAGS